MVKPIKVFRFKEIYINQSGVFGNASSEPMLSFINQALVAQPQWNLKWNLKCLIRIMHLNCKLLAIFLSDHCIWQDCSTGRTNITLWITYRITYQGQQLHIKPFNPASVRVKRISPSYRQIHVLYTTDLSDKMKYIIIWRNVNTQIKLTQIRHIQLSLITEGPVNNMSHLI